MVQKRATTEEYAVPDVKVRALEVNEMFLIPPSPFKNPIPELNTKLLPRVKERKQEYIGVRVEAYALAF
jgi:hypothetical protein